MGPFATVDGIPIGEAWLVINKTEEAVQITHEDGERRLSNTTIIMIPAGSHVLRLRTSENRQ